MFYIAHLPLNSHEQTNFCKAASIHRVEGIIRTCVSVFHLYSLGGKVIAYDFTEVINSM